MMEKLGSSHSSKTGQRSVRAAVSPSICPQKEPDAGNPELANHPEGGGAAPASIPGKYSTETEEIGISEKGVSG